MAATETLGLVTMSTRYFLMALDDADADALIIQGRMPHAERARPLEVTLPLLEAASAAGALARAVEFRVDEGDDDSYEEALERLTANYGRAAIEEDGHEALQHLMDRPHAHGGTMTIDCPNPGVRLAAIPGIDHPWGASTVIASGVHIDEGPATPERPDERNMVVYGVLVMNPEPHYFTVLELVSRDFETITEVIDLGTEANIVPAVHVFHENFGFWGGGALTNLGNESPHG